MREMVSRVLSVVAPTKIGTLSFSALAVSTTAWAKVFHSSRVSVAISPRVPFVAMASTPSRMRLAIIRWVSSTSTVSTASTAEAPGKEGVGG
jgi:hypothetical protein